ncbi:unnamed protein product [Cochlearia groenlandica]
MMGEAKILVEVKLDRPFPQRVALEDESGTISLVSVIYSWLPSVCSKCGQLGHKAKRCLDLPVPGNKATQTHLAKESSNSQAQDVVSLVFDIPEKDVSFDSQGCIVLDQEGSDVIQSNMLFEPASKTIVITNNDGDMNSLEPSESLMRESATNVILETHISLGTLETESLQTSSASLMEGTQLLSNVVVENIVEPSSGEVSETHVQISNVLDNLEISRDLSSPMVFGSHSGEVSRDFVSSFSPSSSQAKISNFFAPFAASVASNKDDFVMKTDLFASPFSNDMAQRSRGNIIHLSNFRKKKL